MISQRGTSTVSSGVPRGRGGGLEDEETHLRHLLFSLPCLKSLTAASYVEEFPEAAAVVHNTFYVDDCGDDAERDK